VRREEAEAFLAVLEQTLTLMRDHLDNEERMHVGTCEPLLPP